MKRPKSRRGYVNSVIPFPRLAIGRSSTGQSGSTMPCHSLTFGVELYAVLACLLSMAPNCYAYFTWYGPGLLHLHATSPKRLTTYPIHRTMISAALLVPGPRVTTDKTSNFSALNNLIQSYLYAAHLSIIWRFSRYPFAVGA